MSFVMVLSRAPGHVQRLIMIHVVVVILVNIMVNFKERNV